MDYTDFVDQIVREAVVMRPPDRLAQWQADVAAEQAAIDAPPPAA